MSHQEPFKFSEKKRNERSKSKKLKNFKSEIILDDKIFGGYSNYQVENVEKKNLSRNLKKRKKYNYNQSSMKKLQSNTMLYGSNKFLSPEINRKHFEKKFMGKNLKRKKMKIKNLHKKNKIKDFQKSLIKKLNKKESKIFLSNSEIENSQEYKNIYDLSKNLTKKKKNKDYIVINKKDKKNNVELNSENSLDALIIKDKKLKSKKKRKGFKKILSHKNGTLKNNFSLKRKSRKIRNALNNI